MRTFPIAVAALVGAGALMLVQVTTPPTEDKTTPADESARPDPADSNAQAPAPDNGAVLDSAADDRPDDEPADSTDDAPPNMM